MTSRPRHLVDNARLALRTALVFAGVRARVHRVNLPTLVVRLARPPRRPRHAHDPWAPTPRRLSRAVDRTLRLGRHQPTCLVSALVLFRLLRTEGQPAELVIGLPPDAATKDAHAWVELHGRDLGPPPGRAGHLEFARYPAAADGHAVPGRRVAS